MRRYFSPILVLISLAGCEWSALTFRASTGVWSLPASTTPAATQLLVLPANAQESSSRKIRNLEIESLPTLRVGDEAAEVTKLQTNLQKLGYYQGEITNTFNQATEEALIQFQEDSNITADGVAGPNTWKTLLVTAATGADTASDSDTTANQNQTENTEDSQKDRQTGSDQQSDETAQSQSDSNWTRKLSRIALLVVGGIFGIGAFAGLFFILLKLSGGDSEEFETSPRGSGKSSSNQFSSTASASTTNPFATTETETSKASPSEKSPPTSSTTPVATTETSEIEQQKTSVSSSETGVVSPSPSLESSKETTQTNGKSSAQSHTPPHEGENLEKPSSQQSSQSATSISQNQPSQLAKINIVEELIKELQAPDPVKRRKAIWELGQQGDSRAVYPLLNLMLESDSKQQGLILAAMSEIGTRITRPLNQALVMALQADKPEVRKNAIRDLMRVYDAFGEVSHLLSHARHDPDPQVQETAQWAISKLHRLRAIAQGEIPNFSRRFPNEDISLPSPVQQVVNIMLFRGEVTLEEAAECTGYERDTVEKMLEPLLKQKIIDRYEGEEGIYYCLCAQNPNTK